MDIRQSDKYASYMQKISWIVGEIDDVKIYVKKFLFFGSFIKIQRPNTIPSEEFIKRIVKKYNARTISIELNQESKIKNQQLHKFKTNINPFLPTKTIQIDLTQNEDELFSKFSEAKRRAVRRAIKNKILVKDTNKIEVFIKLKSKDFWPMSYLMAKDIRALWESFLPEGAKTLIAYKDFGQAGMTVVAGVILLFHNGVAYYWMAAATEEGKKLFAPTLLVWEALRLSKQKDCEVFDFEGIYDERFHNATKKWKGFTKFKQGFGGKEILFPKPLIRTHSRITF